MKVVLIVLAMLLVPFLAYADPADDERNKTQRVIVEELPGLVIESMPESSDQNVTVESLPNLVIESMPDSNVTVESLPEVVIQSMPPTVNGDHPALTSFYHSVGAQSSGRSAVLVFNPEDSRLCSPGEKMVITAISGGVTGRQPDVSSGFTEYVYLLRPNFYLGPAVESVGRGQWDRFLIYRYETNFIFDFDHPFDIVIAAGDLYPIYGHQALFTILGHCFTP